MLFAPGWYSSVVTLMALAAPAPGDRSLPPGAAVRLGDGRLLHAGRVLAIAFSPDGKTLISAAEDGLRCWDLATGTEAGRMPHPGCVAATVSVAGGRLLAATCAAGRVVVWDVA